MIDDWWLYEVKSKGGQSLQCITWSESSLAFMETPRKDWQMWLWAKLPQLLVVQWRNCSHEVSQLMRQKVTIPHKLREAIHCRLRLLNDQAFSTNHNSFLIAPFFNVFCTDDVSEELFSKVKVALLYMFEICFLYRTTNILKTYLICQFEWLGSLWSNCIQ